MPWMLPPMKALSVLPGAAPVDQLAPVFQSPPCVLTKVSVKFCSTKPKVSDAPVAKPAASASSAPFRWTV